MSRSKRVCVEGWGEKVCVWGDCHSPLIQFQLQDHFFPGFTPALLSSGQMHRNQEEFMVR